MSLADEAAKDLRTILNDCTGGFSSFVTLVSPDGRKEGVYGIVNDISQVIDPETGQLVNARLSTITIALADLYAINYDIPYGVADTRQKPWLVIVKSTCATKETTFKVTRSDPDRSLPQLTCMLEVYRDQ